MISQPHEYCVECLQRVISWNGKRPWTVRAYTRSFIDTRAGSVRSLQTYSRLYRGVNPAIRGGRAYSGHRILPLLIWLLTAVQAASALNFNNPSIPAQELCSTVTFSWSGGTPNFELQIIDANTQLVVEDFTGIAGTSLEWVADGKVQGRNVIAKVMDAAGESAVTELIPISPGSPNACGPGSGATPNSPSSTSSPLIPPSTPTPIAPPPKLSTSSSQTTTTTTTSTSLPPLPPHTSTSPLQSITSKALPPPPSTTSAPAESSSSSSSLPSSTPDSTSISSTSTTNASSTTTGLSQPPSSPISAPGPTQSQAVPSSPSISASSSSSSPPSLPSTAPAKTASPSLSPGAKAAIITTIIVLIVALGALAFWLHRRAARRWKVVRSSGERADLQETCPLLSEPDVPGRAVIAQRAWAGSSPPWLREQPSTFTPADEDDVLVIQRRRTPRSIDAQASGWQSDFAPATTTTSAGHPSLLSTATATTSRADHMEDRFTDSPIDPLLFSGDSTRPSSGCLPSTRPMGDLASFYAMLEAEAASHRREGRLTGTEIDSAVDTASEEWDADELSDTRTMATLPPPYHHHTT